MICPVLIGFAWNGYVTKLHHETDELLAWDCSYCHLLSSSRDAFRLSGSLALMPVESTTDSSGIMQVFDYITLQWSK